MNCHWRIGVFIFLLLPVVAFALQPKEKGPLDSRAFFQPELYISSTHDRLEDIQARLPNQADWAAFRSLRPGQDFRVYIDPRGGVPSNIMGSIPLFAGKGVGNQLSTEHISPKNVADLVVQFVRDNRTVFAVDLNQMGGAKAELVADDLWHVNIPQSVNGVPVRYGRIAATIKYGNLILIGTETWGNARINTTPRITGDQALEKGFQHAGGRQPQDLLIQNPKLEIVPYATETTGSSRKAYGHYLVWTFQFQREQYGATWEVMVNAHSGKVISFQDVNQYVEKKINGGVYPITNTEVCPTATTCGTMQSGYPMPWANTGLASPNNFTNSAGTFDYTSGTVTTTLNGRFVRVLDSCGAISQSASGDVLMGGLNGQHDCTSAGGSLGNTASSRSCFYETNKLEEVARGWLPSNAWLQSQLTANVNINLTCNAFWNGSTVNFYRSGGGCRNTGEIAGVFDHEWGHGLDDNDTGGALSSSSEGYADIAAIYRLQASCVGHGFFWTSNKGCGNTVDGTGFNANEAQVGSSHCDLDCSGVRDADWNKHADHAPDTPLGFVCNSCSSSTGPCGRQVHCAAAPARQAAWDFAARDLQSAPFNYDSNTAFTIASKIFYQGSGNIGAWHSCTCGSSSSGCGSTNAYMQWLAADDDNGNLNDGTPHMTALFNAFNRHGIACSTPTPVNAGCASGPTAATTVNATPGDSQVALSWTAVGNASKYFVLRTEGHAGCNLGKALIAQPTGTTFTDTEVLNDRPYYYTVMAAGTSSACLAPSSVCVTATPVAGGGCTLPTATSNVSPSNGATGTSTTPTLDWSDVGGATSYEVQVATDSGFTNVVRSQTGLASSQWTVSPALPNSTQHFWRARAVNSCGPGPYSTAFSFTTAAAAVGDFSISCTPTSLSIPWGQNRTSTCTLTSISGFSSAVSLSCSGLPSKVSCSFNPASVTPTGNSTLTVTALQGSKTGISTIQVTGTGGSKTHSTSLQLNISKK